MKKLFIFFVLVFVFGRAFASAPQTYYSFAGGARTLDGGSLCPAVFDSIGHTEPHTIAFLPPNQCRVTDTSGYVYNIGGIDYVSLCADGSQPNNTSGLPLAQQCPDPVPPKCIPASIGITPILMAWATGYKSGSAIAITVTTADQLLNNQFCNGSCEVQFTPGQSRVQASASTTPGANGYYAIYAHVDMTKTGNTCTPGQPGSSPSATNEPLTGDSGGEPTAPPPSTPGACPTGSVPGGQDAEGMTICIGTKTPSDPPSKTTITTSPVTTTDANGNSVTSQSTTVTNSDGSSTTTTTVTTTSPDGTKSTTVSQSTKPATGSSSGVADSDKPDDLCSKHPELNICQNSQVQGQCALITCTGDAIQCATLRQAADMNCDAKAAADAMNKAPATALGNSILAGSDPMQSQIDAAKVGDTVDLSSTSLDSSGFLGGGACFPDKTLSIAGRSLTVHFSTLCDNIQPLRYAVLACAAIAAYLLVSKSVIQGA